MLAGIFLILFIWFIILMIIKATQFIKYRVFNKKFTDIANEHFGTTKPYKTNIASNKLYADVLDTRGITRYAGTEEIQKILVENFYDKSEQECLAFIKKHDECLKRRTAFFERNEAARKTNKESEITINKMNKDEYDRLMCIYKRKGQTHFNRMKQESEFSKRSLVSCQ